MNTRLAIGVAVLVSVIGHLGVIAGVIMDETRPLPADATQAIAVEVVTPEPPEPLSQDEADDKAKAPAEPAKPEFKLPDFRFTPTDQQQAALQPAEPAQAAPSAQAQQQQAAASGSQSAASAARPPQSDPPPSQSEQQQQQQAAAQASVPAEAEPPQAPAVAPDLTVKYGIMFGLPDGDGGVAAYKKADVAPVDVAMFRMHLRTCAKLPRGVSHTDRVRIVLRVFLGQDGRLMMEPALVEASASAKGPLLMHAAMAALEACQPFTMLPVARYDEWKVLDLSFNPGDFAG